MYIFSNKSSKPLEKKKIAKLEKHVIKILKDYSKSQLLRFSLLDARCPQKWFYHSSFLTGQGRRNMTKGSQAEIRTGRDYHHGQNRLNFRKLVISNQIAVG